MYNFQGKWGLVLSGGGAKGAFQIGVFKALEELVPQLEFAGVAGTSVGALNLALYVQKDVKLCEEIWGNISPSAFMDVDLKLFDMKEGLCAREGLVKLMDDYVNLELVSNCNVPLYCTTSQIDAGNSMHAVYHLVNRMTREEIKNVLLASSALPVVYEPVKIGNHYHKDGGLCDNRPIWPLYELGIRQFIVISMDTDSQVNYRLFPGSRILHIKPGRSIGGLSDGTLDFNSDNAKVRIKQGYYDAVNALKQYNGQEFWEDDITVSDAEKLSYTQMEFDIKSEWLSDKVNRNFNKIEELMKKYDI